jgi:hypothetical protein
MVAGPGPQTETRTSTLLSQFQAFHSATQTQTKSPSTFDSSFNAQEEAPQF